MTQATAVSSPPITKGEYAYVELRRRIMDGALVPGARLALRPLADELGLSVMPVREAFLRLQEDGLIRFEDHRGATVTEISPQDVLAGMEVRMWNEILAVREATPRHTGATLAAAETALKAAAERTHDWMEFTSLNRQFHEAIESPASAIVRAVIADVWTRIWHARRYCALYAQVPAQMTAAHAEHELILDAVRSGDADAAAAAMSAHRDSTISAWKDVLPRLNPRPPGTSAAPAPGAGALTDRGDKG